MDPSKIAVHILVGELSTDHAVSDSLLLTNEYGKEEQRQDLSTALRRAAFAQVTIHSTNLENFRDLLDGLVRESDRLKADGCQLVLLNLIDGTEVDGYPGLTVIRYIETLNVPFTGSDATFYHISTSKPRLKQALLNHHVATPKYVEVRSKKTVQEDVISAGELTGFPLIIKPSISYASYGISDQSVVHNAQDAIRHIEKLLLDEPASDGIFLEKFLSGREFTVLVTGSSATGVKVFPAVERVFNESLPVEKRFLAFERYWSGYDLAGNEPTTRVYEYRIASEKDQETLQQLARDAYLALGGSGYARVDIREDGPGSSQLYVLEVNAQCGVAFSSSSTMGEILAISKTAPEDFLSRLIEFALIRNQFPQTNEKAS
ncbi:hypothetical protein RvY_00993 [Ramazzottius varieornatus]|uniref:ATP-grasp domain-containing protein n=1 Tax=Ramazzottius varieornatus TaxID=947166 RepID=A0A1D1UEQ9_RAMVA|nr:hypothetical protein RvY_00993 [Ramazzottius varieornatus]